MAPWIDEVRNRCREEFGEQGWVCVMATVDSGGKPTARCMLCREIDNQGRLLFVSDRRTRKDDHLRATPDTEICFWLPKLATQVRLRGTACIVDAVLDHFMRENWWEQMSPTSRAVINRAAANDTMPGTFELIVIDPAEIELDDLKTRPISRQSWKHPGTPAREAVGAAG